MREGVHYIICVCVCVCCSTCARVREVHAYICTHDATNSHIPLASTRTQLAENSETASSSSPDHFLLHPAPATDVSPTAQPQFLQPNKKKAISHNNNKNYTFLQLQWYLHNF